MTLENANFPRLLTITAAVLGLALAVVVVSRIVYPFDGGIFEGLSWIPACHLWDGRNPYSFAAVPPYSMAPYGVLFYASLAPGLAIGDLPFWWGRGMSVLAFLICLALIFSIAKKVTDKPKSALFAAIFATALFPVQSWIAWMRPDFLAIAFSLASFRLVLEIDTYKKSEYRVAALLALLAACAFFSKTTAALPAAVAVIRFAQTRNVRSAVVFLIVFATIVGLGILTLDLSSSGGYIWQHFTHAWSLPADTGNLGLLVELFTAQPTSWLIAACLLIFAYSLVWDVDGGRNSFASVVRSRGFLMFVYFSISFGWAVLSSQRVGASVNYFLEASMLAAVIAGVVWHELLAQGRRRVAVGLLLFLVAGGLFQATRVIRGEYFRWQALPYYREVSRKVAEITPPGSECLSVYPELVHEAQCAARFDDFAEYSSGWSPKLNEIFKSELASGRYKTVVWSRDDFAAEFLNYHLVEVLAPPPMRARKLYVFAADPAAAPAYPK